MKPHDDIKPQLLTSFQSVYHAIRLNLYSSLTRVLETKPHEQRNNKSHIKHVKDSSKEKPYKTEISISSDS